MAFAHYMENPVEQIDPGALSLLSLEQLLLHEKRGRLSGSTRRLGIESMLIKLILVFVLLGGVAVFAYAQQRAPRRQQILILALAEAPYQASIDSDRMFLEKAANAGVYGLLLGTMGIERTQNAEVRAFAERMVHANQFINIELTSVVQRNGVIAARSLNPAQRTLLQQLAQLSGPAFDDMFLNAALNEYREAMRVFQEEIQAGQHKGLQDFAYGSIRRLKNQLAFAEKARASIGKRTPNAA